MTASSSRYGGQRVADVLQRHGVRFLFTLCGGHIAPILVACNQQGIRVVDVRHEATAVFAADAVSRLSGVPGVAAVTAGPGLTNTITAVKNAQLAQSPLVVLGGATATLLKGRGSLQDIDQLALMRPHVKFAALVRRVREIEPALERAFAEAQSGVPGPVFVELPIDLLYPAELVSTFYAQGSPESQPGRRTLRGRLLNWYLRRHVRRLFAEGGPAAAAPPVTVPLAGARQLSRVAKLLDRAQRPLLLVGSQATLDAAHIGAVRSAVEALELPVYLSGMARGLLGRSHPLLLRHRRKPALREADLVLLAGVPADFRLNYGRDIAPRAQVVGINRSRKDLTKNRRPSQALLADPGAALLGLAGLAAPGRWRREAWLRIRQEADQAREEQIAVLSAPTVQSAPAAQAAPGAPGGAEEAGLNPLRLLRRLEDTLSEDSIIVGDGGDFVGTASYVVKPRAPLSWLDPGVFGTLGAGAGFALGAKLCRPQAEVWVLFGDGSVGYSLAEWDTFIRHRVPVLAVVGNDAGWSQIARDQVQLLHDDVGTVLRHAGYERVAQGLDAEGLLLSQDEQIGPTLRRAKELAAGGRPVLVNALCARTDFRKGSISM